MNICPGSRREKENLALEQQNKSIIITSSALCTCVHVCDRVNVQMYVIVECLSRSFEKQQEKRIRFYDGLSTNSVLLLIKVEKPDHQINTKCSVPETENRKFNKILISCRSMI